MSDKPKEQETWFVPAWDIISGFRSAQDSDPSSTDPKFRRLGYTLAKIGTDIFNTQEAAAKAGFAQRDKRRASLMKQIAKLDKLDEKR